MTRQKRFEGEPTRNQLGSAARIANAIASILIMAVAPLYSILLPLKLGTFWFYAGLPIYLVALAMALMAGISLSTAPLAEPITDGVYAVSRHPAYLGSFLAYVGIGVSCASRVFLLFALKWIVACHFVAIEEERFLVRKYGDAYRDYMNRTPRWIGFPRSK